MRPSPPAGSVPHVRIATRKDSAGRHTADVDDETLVAETIAGKRWAQKEVWFRFAPMVYGLFRTTFGQRHDHEDLVQEVFLRVFSRLRSLEKPSAIRSFIYSVAVRVAAEKIRRHSILRRARDQLLLGRTWSSSASMIEARDILFRIERVLGGLKEKHRVVFVLRHVEEMKLEEIADALNLSLASVKRNLAKAMRSIERAMIVGVDIRAALPEVGSA